MYENRHGPSVTPAEFVPAGSVDRILGAQATPHRGISLVLGPASARLGRARTVQVRQVTGRRIYGDHVRPDWRCSAPPKRNPDRPAIAENCRGACPARRPESP